MAVLNNLWLRGGKQRLAGAVLYQLNGQTIARELAPAITNPRTDAQMSSRVRLANVVAVYRANRAWMKGSFENKKERESDYNAFLRANLSSSQVALTKTEASQGAAVASPYQVTGGSLLPITHTTSAAIILTDLFVGNLSLDENTTVGALSVALLDNNNSLAEGMQLSLIVNVQQARPADGLPYIIARAYELILNRTSEALVYSYFPSDVQTRAQSAGNNALVLDTTNMGSGAACFILSQTTGGITRVSTQTLFLFGDRSTYTRYTSATQQSDAIASYGDSSTYFLDSNSARAAKEIAKSIRVLSVNTANGTDIMVPDNEVEFSSSTRLSVTFSEEPGRAGDGSTYADDYYITLQSASGEKVADATSVEPVDGEGNPLVINFDVYKEVEIQSEEKLFLHCRTAYGWIVTPIFARLPVV